MLPTLLLIAAIGQMDYNDFEFIQAQENWVVDNLPTKDKALRWHLPKDVYRQVDILFDDCPRCRARAFDDLVEMGPDVIRWMIWVRRSKNPRVANDAEEIIARVALCPVCNGTGKCPGYSGGPEDGDPCSNCRAYKYSHQWDYVPRYCKHCDGRGFFKTAEPRVVSPVWEPGD